MNATATEPPPIFDQPVHPMVAAARARFLADFPELLAHRHAHPAEKWVAYHGARRLAFGTSKIALVRECLGRGLAPGEFLVLGIDPAVAEPNG